LNDGGEVKVNKQVLVAFYIDKYCDEVLCDVVTMQASHLCLVDHDRMIAELCMME
jgi:hypothetical protein